MQMLRKAAAIVAVMGLGVLAVCGVVNIFSSSPNGMYECSLNSAPRVFEPSDAPRSPVIFPVAYENERTISPVTLREPTGTRVISPSGATTQVVVLTYGRDYLRAVRVQAGASFRGIAPLDPVSVPANVREDYPRDTEFVIAPDSCLPK